MKPVQDELAAGNQESEVFPSLAARFQRGCLFHQSLNLVQLPKGFARRGGFGKLQGPPQIEPVHDVLQVRRIVVAGKNLSHGAACQVLGHLLGALQLPFIFQFHLAGHGRQGGVNIADARNDLLFSAGEAPALGIGDHVLQDADGQPLAHARTLVHLLVPAGQKGDGLDHLLDEAGNPKAAPAPRTVQPGFLLGNPDAFLEGNRIVGSHFGADAVFQGSDDFSASGVVLGIGRKDHHHVQLETHGVAFDLDVPLLQNVEKPHLNLPGQVGKLVDGKQAPVGSGKQPVVDGQLVGEVEPAASGTDGVDVPDHIGNGHVRRGQLLHVAGFPGQKGDGRLISPLFHQGAAGAAVRPEGIVIDFAAGHDRNFLVQELGESPQDPGFGLAAQPQ